MTRVIETYGTWDVVRVRLSDLRCAGLHAQATDMGDHIAVIIDGGKRGRDVAKILAQIPRRTTEG
jgi:hypothetical protein